MEEKIVKAEMLKRIAKRLQQEGKRYGQEKVRDILDAFLDELVEAMGNGDSVVFNGYFILEPQFRKERKGQDIYNKKEVIIPAQYKPHLQPGIKLEEAAQLYTEKKLSQ